MDSVCEKHKLISTYMRYFILLFPEAKNILLYQLYN